MPYGDTHRFVLRTIASQSVMSLEDTKKLIEKRAGNENANVKEMFQEINEKIKPLSQMIKIVNDEVTSEQLVVFLSLGYDDTSKAQNVFSPIELEFFRLLMEQIMSTDTREITEMAALHLVNNIKVNNRLLSIDHAQKLLNTWCRMRYLDHTERNYALGVRAIHEFESYFTKAIADSDNMKCFMCTSIVFRGYNCPNCPKTIHIRCLELSLKKAQKWPCCKTAYIHSQLQDLRGQSSRLNNNSTRESQELEPTQRLETTQTNGNSHLLSPEHSAHDVEMDTDECNTIIRPGKRRRLNS